MQRRNNNNVRRQKKKKDDSKSKDRDTNNNNKKIENRLGETVRIASIVQKCMKTGRSSYVEMRALGRLTNHNIKSRVEAVRPLVPKDAGEAQELLSRLPAVVSEGYADMLTPNGTVRERELDRLLAIDADIVTCLGILESELRPAPEASAVKSRTTTTAATTTESAEADGALAALRELVKERKEFVGALRASGAS